MSLDGGLALCAARGSGLGRRGCRSPSRPHYFDRVKAATLGKINQRVDSLANGGGGVGSFHAGLCLHDEVMRLGGDAAGEVNAQASVLGGGFAWHGGLSVGAGGLGDDFGADGAAVCAQMVVAAVVAESGERSPESGEGVVVAEAEGLHGDGAGWKVVSDVA